MSMYSWGNNLYSGKTSYPLIQKRMYWFSAAIALVLVSLISFATITPNLGIEFRGGSQFTVSGTAVTDLKPATDVVTKIGKDSAPRVTNVGSDTIRVQTGQLSDQETQKVRAELASAYKVSETEVTSTFIGPSWGADIMSKAIRAMIVFMVIVSLIMTIYFRSWAIAVGAMGALLHDFIVTLGVYWIGGFEITPATVIGLLTIMGYSLYDTVVVFDKVRENTVELRGQNDMTYEESANLAINQTLIRSLNTSITGLLPVMSVLFVGVYLLGADTLRDLALVMFVGMILSTLSSIFLAAPFAVALGMRNDAVKEHTAAVLKMRSESRDKAANLASTDENSGNIESSHVRSKSGAKKRKKK
ncbi:preprotein translocase subunit SecF [Arcanobacterium wilhelmae]|uniref:Protein-export membrane protein SecF n=1 Tax=Arcanobacterium wilhelmae TaxID=1803177 RepID=A0ABT9N8P0_9ACTO|nr:protein translocase subunit SecF [Arcanobacterium wilhelmae]MDP9800060.1 preprotein translocase subunit SecF [Arcanobacterium wilhelmae]WFN89555.1 protein translocase subunit SecF [Arcanobacterium wilhelmae]